METPREVLERCDTAPSFEEMREALRASLVEETRLKNKLALLGKGRQDSYCLGVATIRELAEDGQTSCDGWNFVAASDLYKKDPTLSCSKPKTC